MLSMLNMLLTCCLSGVVKGSIHNRVVGSRAPVQIVVLFLLTLMFVLSNITSQSSSHNLDTDTKECLARPGSTNPVAACWLIWCMSRRHCVLVLRVAPLGSATVMLFLVGIHLNAALGKRKCEMAPESAMAKEVDEELGTK